MATEAYGRRYRSDAELSQAIRTLLWASGLSPAEFARGMELAEDDAQALLDATEHVSARSVVQAAGLFKVEPGALLYAEAPTHGLFRSGASPQNEAEALEIAGRFAASYRRLSAVAG